MLRLTALVEGSKQEIMPLRPLNRTLLALLIAGTGVALAQPPAANRRPQLRREFRGVWVATVGNIDWPSRKGLSTTQQQAELRTILDQSVALGLNAIVLQVRPMCDALYASKREPWSEFLTGRLGQAPAPLYDPLEFAVREAHVRGLELHAWFNPFRAKVPAAKAPIPADHLVKRRPDLAKPYGKHYWLDPGEPDAQKHSLAVILDVVRRYDVDGIHLDDYFYPYKEQDSAGKVIPFPDDASWKKYQAGGGTLGRDDWRRDNINRFVEHLYQAVKAEKRWVKVGISPFGIWRPGHPPGIEGFDQYAQLYADAKFWLQRGWVDYFTPQLYWQIHREKQSYPKLLAWWAEQNTQGRHLWPGNIPSRVTGGGTGWPAQEIVDQIELTRKQPGATGNILFSMRPLLADRGGVATALKQVYAEPALIPASPWLSQRRPASPKVSDGSKAGAGTEITVDAPNAAWIVVAGKTESGWTAKTYWAADHAHHRFLLPPTLAAAAPLLALALDRFGQESEPVAVPAAN